MSITSGVRIAAYTGPDMARKVPHGVDAMISYSFDSSPIYGAGNVAAAWAVTALLFAVLLFA